LIALGAYHGVNPAMGWLFAVSQGMQHESRRAVVRALGPIAIGHELSIMLVAAVVLGAAAVVDSSVLHVAAAAVLLAFGIFRFVRPRAHWRWTTMRVSARELTLWSFLMSTAHGAGLMIAPVLLGLDGVASASADVHAHDHAEAGMLSGVAAAPAAVGITLHVVAMLVVMGAIAIVVYDKLGLAVLRRAWVNTDQLWAFAFICAAAITLIGA
jgi:hypothetical protein